MSFNYNDKRIDFIVSNYEPKAKAVIIQKDTLIIIHDKFNCGNLYQLCKRLDSEIKNLKNDINAINDRLNSSKIL